MLIPVGDGRQRCWWPGDDAQYQRYHDDEWGRATTDDSVLFEKMCLEGFQSGLSWLTILRKRENFREAFSSFDHHAIAGYTQKDVTALLNNAGIVRHRGKIEAVINNAQRLCELEEQNISLRDYLWSYASPQDFGQTHSGKNDRVLMSTSPASEAMSKDLKKRGWKFVGPTTMYSMMQSMGLVNDHIDGCFVREECEDARRAVIRKLFPEAK